MTSPITPTQVYRIAICTDGSLQELDDLGNHMIVEIKAESEDDALRQAKSAIPSAYNFQVLEAQGENHNAWREQLSFLDNPLQTSGNRILDKELTVRLLWAIYYQANAADQWEDDDPDYCAQPWQDSSMVSSVCNPISNIMVALGAGRMDEVMCDCGEYLFGVKSPDKYEIVRKLENIQEDITGDAMSSWLPIPEEGFMRSAEGRRGVNLYLAWDGSRSLRVDVAGCLDDLEKWESFKEDTERREGKGWHFMKAELFEAPADVNKGDEEREGMAQVICDLFAKIKAGGSQCQ